MGRCGGLEGELILTVSTLGGCGGLERTDFNSFYFGSVAVLKELILIVSTFEGVAVLKELILTVSSLGRCGGLESIYLSWIYQFLLWEGMAV